MRKELLLMVFGYVFGQVAASPIFFYPELELNKEYAPKESLKAFKNSESKKSRSHWLISPVSCSYQLLTAISQFSGNIVRF